METTNQTMTRTTKLAAVLLGLEAVYLAASALWLAQGHGFALGSAWNPIATAAVGVPLLMLAAAGAVIAGVVVVRGAGGAGTRWASVVMAAVSLVVALVIVGDARLLALLGYLPLLLLIAVGVVPGELPDPAQLALPYLAHQVLLLVIAGGWTMLAVRLSHRGTLNSGARAGKAGSFVLEHRVAITLVAAAVPALYAITRFAWSAGIPLGLDGATAGMVIAGGAGSSALGLASMATFGVVLTLGLIQPWGRQWPRWVPGLGGRPVPVGLAVVPAVLVAMILVPAGTDMVRLAFSPSKDGGIPSFSLDNWGALGPNLLWHVWALALAAAAYGYWLMRKGYVTEPAK